MRVERNTLLPASVHPLLDLSEGNRNAKEQIQKSQETQISIQVKIKVKIQVKRPRRSEGQQATQGARGFKRETKGPVEVEGS